MSTSTHVGPSARLHDLRQDDEMHAETQAVMDWLRRDERTAARMNMGTLSPMEVAVASVLARREIATEAQTQEVQS